MRGTYLFATVAFFVLSTSGLSAGPFLPNTDAAAGTSLTLVHSSCHDDVRQHGGYEHYHQWQGGSCLTYSTQGGGGHCHSDVRYHSHPGYGSVHHDHQGGNCAVVQRYQNYPRQDNCVTLGTPAFGFQLCD